MMTELRVLAVCLTTLIATCAASASDSPDEKTQLKFFETKVRPLLAKHCIKCHGGGKFKGGLRMVSHASRVRGGESGAAGVPGKPDESLLIEAVRYESLEMPPAGKLPEADIKLLEAWVKAGAFWPDTGEKVREPSAQFTDEERTWWSFQPVVKPAVPDRLDSWCRNEIDFFILRKLAQTKLSPALEADRRTLIRRLYADLIGLPPTAAQIEAFEKDESEDAYEKLVDQLLASPRYGEQWARHAESRGGCRCRPTSGGRCEKVAAGRD